MLAVYVTPESVERDMIELMLLPTAEDKIAWRLFEYPSLPWILNE